MLGGVDGRTGYLLCVGNTHDEHLGGKRKREGELFVIRALFQCLEGMTKGTLSNTQRAIRHQHHLYSITVQLTPSDPQHHSTAHTL